MDVEAGADPESPWGGAVIFIAHEVGSSEFEDPLRKLGLPVHVRALESADFAFWGQGPDGECRVGIERKTVSELVGVQSNKRLTGRQLPRMTKRYRFRFLIVEGLTRVAWDGLLESARPVKNGQMSYWVPAGYGRGMAFESYIKRLMTFQLKAAITVVWSPDRTGTAHLIHAIYRWFQEPWASHRSHLQVEEAQPDEALLDERTLRRQILAQIPGVGWTRSATLSKHFEGTPLREMFQWVATATPDEWRRALGFKDGMGTARRIHAAIHTTGEQDAKGY